MIDRLDLEFRQDPLQEVVLHDRTGELSGHHFLEFRGQRLQIES